MRLVSLHIPNDGAHRSATGTMMLPAEKIRISSFERAPIRACCVERPGHKAPHEAASRVMGEPRQRRTPPMAPGAPLRFRHPDTCPGAGWHGRVKPTCPHKRTVFCPECRILACGSEDMSTVGGRSLLGGLRGTARCGAAQ